MPMVTFYHTGIFSVAYGVVADIATPAERGSYVAAVSFAYAHLLLSGYPS